MPERILEMKNITKKFVGTVALNDVSITLHKGEILAVLGENGAGKSTLMKVLSGTYPSNSYTGEVWVNESKCSFSSTRDAESFGIAMIPQEINLELDLSIAENIALGRMPVTKLGMIDWRATNRRAGEILASLNVHDIDVTMPVRNLNASMQQIVSIARALYREPKILILDEPTSCLTENETKNLFDSVNKLRENGIACLYISHKLDEVFALCDRVVVLRDGRYISQYERSAFDSAGIIADIVGRRMKAERAQTQKQLGPECLRIEHFCVPHPFTYGASIIEDASFSLHRGEILGLCGLVGSGRSELLNAIFGIMEKTKGSVYIDGKEAAIRNATDAKKYGIGLLTEDRKKNGYIGCLNIAENMTVTILREISRRGLIDKEKQSSTVSRYFESMKIKAPGPETNILSLSGGNQQKVLVAKWLATNSNILFLDEPTRGIDIGTKRELYDLIRDLAGNGMSVVIVSSEMQELIGLCDRFLILSRGRIRHTLSREEASEEKILHLCSNV